MSVDSTSTSRPSEPANPASSHQPMAIQQRLIRQRYQHKRYRLKGYTTPSRVRDKYQKTLRQNQAIHLLTMVLVFIGLLILWFWIHPFEILKELGKSLGF